MTDESYRTNDRRVIPWLLLALVALVGALYVAGYYVTSDRIPRGTTVSGVAVGGMTPAAAERRLTHRLRSLSTEPIEVTAAGRRATIKPASAGLAVDVPATIDRAGAGRSWDPRRMWDYFSGGDDIDAVVTVDRDALSSALDPFARRVDESATEGKVAFADGQPEATYPEKGTVLDRPAAVKALQAGYLHTEGPVELPITLDEPTITKDAVSRAMDRFANPAMSGPVVVRLGGEDVELLPEDFAPAISMVAVGSELQPRLDDRALLKALEPKMRTIALAPKDASVAIVDGHPKIVPAKAGVTFDPKDVTEPFLDVVTKDGDQRLVNVDSVVAQPEVTTAEVRRLGIRERVSTFTTNFPHADYRNVNLTRAAQLVDGTLLQPGETFSLNDTVGERTPANGFAKGFIISDGVFREDFGGGVSQVATTTFNAAFFAGLKDVEHKPHSFYIDRYPVGREATVAWGAVDLRFKNTTPYGVLIQAHVDKSTPSTQGAMTVSMWSTKYWDIEAEQSGRYNTTPPSTRRLSGPECVPNEGYNGFDIDVYRLFYRAESSKLHHRETMHTHYIPSDTVICS